MTTHLRVIVILWLVDCFITHDCDVIWCNNFCTWLTLWVMGFTHVTHLSTWLGLRSLKLVNGMLRDDSCDSSMDFVLWLITSHRGLCSVRWWVTRVRVVGRCLYKVLGSDQRIGSSRNHLSNTTLGYWSTGQALWQRPSRGARYATLLLYFLRKPLWLKREHIVLWRLDFVPSGLMMIRLPPTRLWR